MAAPKKQQSADPVEAKLDEVVRLLALSVRRDRPLVEVIEELSSAGFGPTRIAELVGTSTGYAKVAIARSKKTPKKKAA